MAEVEFGNQQFELILPMILKHSRESPLEILINNITEFTISDYWFVSFC